MKPDSHFTASVNRIRERIATRTLPGVVMTLALIILAGCGLGGEAATPIPTPMPEPTPTPTAPVEPRIVVNVLDRDFQFIGSPEEIVLDNCGGLRDSELQQTVSRSFFTEVEFEVSDQLSGEFGVGAKIVEAKIRNEISAKLGVRIGTQLSRSSVVKATVSPGHRAITTVQYRENWTLGDIEVLRPDGTYIDVLPFSALDSLTFVQHGVVTVDCVTGEVIDVMSENSTPVVMPAKPPQLLATPTPVVIGSISVPGNVADGVVFTAPQAGVYVFQYTGGAYSTYPVDRIPAGVPTWLADVRVFKNRPAQFDGDNINASSEYRLVNLGYGSTAEEVQARAQSNAVPVQIQLLEGDQLFIVAVDARNYYNDNPGQVDFEVSFIPQ